jgi:hypothetical protein
MKLNPKLIERTSRQFEAKAIPDDHSAIPKLKSLFGDHTFFVDARGLNIVEPSGALDAGVRTAQVINLADWKNGNRSDLVRHEPEATDMLVVLEALDETE